MGDPGHKGKLPAMPFYPKITAPGRPGKTAPRFIQDLLYYDSTNHPPTFNLLTDSPAAQQDDGNHQQSAEKPCIHRYLTKPSQTNLPHINGEFDPKTTYKVSAICMNCRYHLELAVVYNDWSSAKPDHVHHLVFNAAISKHDDKTCHRLKSQDRKSELYHFFCSVPGCSLQTTATLVSPYLTESWLSILLDEEGVKRRTTDAFERTAESTFVAPPLPITILATLKVYIDIVLGDPQRNRGIAFQNKRFAMAFGLNGVPCKKILEFVGFKSNKDTQAWDPPRPVESGVPYQDPERVFLDDIAQELLCLIKQQPNPEQEAHFVDLSAEFASIQFFRLLSAESYERIDTFFPSKPAGLHPPYYQDLGATEDMSNELIINAYVEQTRSDPARAPYYLKCLSVIGNWRGDIGGKSIADYVEKEYALGRFSDDDIPDAYRFFHLDISDKSLTDENIIGAFFSRLEDSPNDAEPRRQLSRIGDYRRSEAIRAVVEDCVSDVRQALVYLGADENTPDDFIISMYTAKVTDNPACKALANQALVFIADARSSSYLNCFLETGEPPGEMSLAEACGIIGLTDLEGADHDSILAHYHYARDEIGIDKAKNALRVIADATRSELLLRELDDSLSMEDVIERLDWPVGLCNIGNTCYLNSLLQFFFTVTPFRAMVLDFEKFRMPLNDESLKNKKVGNRKVSRAEVEQSQKFICELRSLFQDMIHAEARCIIPRTELAELMFLGSSPIEEKPVVYGPHLPEGMQIDDQQNNGQMVSIPDQQDATALASSGVDTRTDDKENVEPQETSSGPKEAESSCNSVSMQDGSNEGSPPPRRPPPVPPRPASHNVMKRPEFNTQQDVTEVINNLLFQAQCAIMQPAESQNPGQYDLITALFYGKTKSHITTPDGTRSQDEVWSDIKVDVTRQASDIYSALDGAFDMQRVLVDGGEAAQHSTITKFPPILQIQIQRVQFDQVEKKSFKSNNHLQLQETIYLDRYAENDKGTAIEDKRREKWRLKEEIQKLEKLKAELHNESNQPYSDVFHSVRDKIDEMSLVQDTSDTHAIVEDIHIDGSTIALLDELGERLDAEIRAINDQIQTLRQRIENLFSEDKEVCYRLYAVFMHRGSHATGHYWLYMFDNSYDIWREYNDERVTEVNDLSAIFPSETRPNSASPYYLVYVDANYPSITQPMVRAGFGEEIINAVEKPLMNDSATYEEMDRSFDLLEEARRGMSEGAKEVELKLPPATNPLKRKH